jgi:hypothetical protein
MPDDRKAEYERQMAATRKANAESAVAMSAPPTPTQEENDLQALGLMSPSDKKSGAPEPRKEPPHEAEARSPPPQRRT